MLRRAARAFTVWANDASGRCGRSFVRPDKRVTPPGSGMANRARRGHVETSIARGADGRHVRGTRPRRAGGRAFVHAGQTVQPDVLLARRPSRLAKAQNPRCRISEKCVNRCRISVICVRRTRIWPDSRTKTCIWRKSGTRGFQNPLQWVPSMPSSSFQSATRAARSSRARLTETLRSGRPMSRRARAMTPSM